MQSGRRLATFVLLAFVACAKPIPPERASYVGEWEAPGMSLLITQDGSVAYKRLFGGASKQVRGPLKSFEGNNFAVGIGFIATTFQVSAAPHADGDAWKMTVDGVELTRRR
jgi:hypothetical protein